MSSNKNKLTFLVTILLLNSWYVNSETNKKDKEECTEQLVGLATCLPYVGGNAKSPTPDCCTGLKKVLSTNKKCLCVIIQDRNDPDLGLTINVTLALGLPTVCQAPANVSQCPDLLHLDPNSPDAKLFYQFGHGSNAAAPANSPISSVTANSTSRNNNRGIRPPQNTSESARRWELEFCLYMSIMVLCSLIFY